MPGVSSAWHCRARIKRAARTCARWQLRMRLTAQYRRLGGGALRMHGCTVAGAHSVRRLSSATQHGLMGDDVHAAEQAERIRKLESQLASLPSIAVVGTGRMGALRMHGIKG